MTNRISALLLAGANWPERLIACVGAVLGIGLTMVVCAGVPMAAADLPIIVAPLGASAVLVFAVPSSPLAQPWPVVGGNILSTLVGVTVFKLIPHPTVAAGVAVGCAILVMSLLRCLHPPGGAAALTAVIGSQGIHAAGYDFAFAPVGINSIALVALAMMFHRATARSYPHQPAPVSAPGLHAADIDAALAQFDEVLDIDPGDLQVILRRAQVHASLRQSGQTTCGALVTRGIRAIAPDTPLRDALASLRQHRVTMVPVTDESARVLGIVTQDDLIDKTIGWERRAPRLGLGRRLALMLQRGRAPQGTVADVMTTGTITLQPHTAAGQAAWLMMQGGLRQAPVVGADGRLIGIVDQMDLIGAMLADIAHDHAGHASPERRQAGRRAG